jgi:hypothetical protein
MAWRRSISSVSNDEENFLARTRVLLYRGVG